MGLLKGVRLLITFLIRVFGCCVVGFVFRWLRRFWDLFESGLVISCCLRIILGKLVGLVLEKGC